jgi:hypothetical protein
MAATGAIEETGTWRPSAANSLSSLLQEEKAAQARPMPKAADEGTPEVSIGGLLDLPPPGEQSITNGHTNGHAGASVEPAARDSFVRPARPAPAPANPYVATPGATYSSPGITQYRPASNRNLIIGIGAGGGLIVLMLFGLIIFLIGRQTPGQQPVAQPPPVLVAQQQPAVTPPPVAQPPIAQPPPAGQPPVAAAGTTQPAGQPPVAAAQQQPAANPGGPLPPGAKQTAPLPPNHNTGGGGTQTARPPPGKQVASAEKQPPAEKPAPAEKPDKAAKPGKVEAKDDGDDFDKAFGSSDDKKGTPKSADTGSKKKDVYIPPAPGAATNDVKESLSQSDVMEIVLAHKPELAKCVSDQHTKEPGVSGLLKMKWSIQTNGATTKVSADSEEFKSTYLAGCIGGLIKGWKFPKSKNPGDPIVFPFKF